MHRRGQMLVLTTLASGLAFAAAVPAAAADSAEQRFRGGQVHRPMPMMRGGQQWGGGHRWNGGARWGQRWNGRWHAGWGAPGGWGGYRFAQPGFQLPGYWMAPTYAIGWQTYHLRRPAAGQTWSRYYDDAVLIDGEGRVIESRRDIDWDRYEGGYEDGDIAYSDEAGFERRRGSAAPGGAVAGAVVGGITGALVGGGVGGTALGAGLGAAAGYGVGSAIDRGRERRLPPPGAAYAWDGDARGGMLPPAQDYGWNEEVVASGTWTGTWTGRTGDGRPYDYQGSFDGQYRGEAPRGPGASYPMPDRGPGQHGRPGGGVYYAPVHNPAIVPGGAATVIINGVAYPAGGHVTGGYYYPPANVTTVTVQTHPVTTTRTVVETVRTRHAPRRWRPRTKGCRC